MDKNGHNAKVIAYAKYSDAKCSGANHIAKVIAYAKYSVWVKK